PGPRRWDLDSTSREFARGPLGTGARRSGHPTDASRQYTPPSGARISPEVSMIRPAKIRIRWPQGGGRLRRILPARWLAAMRSAAATPVEPPAESARDSRARIRVAAAIGAAGYVVVLSVALRCVLDATPLGRAVDVAHDVAGLMLCTLLLAAAQARAMGDRSVFALALTCELLIAAVISLTIPWATYLRTAHLPGITWVVPIMILFPLLVPA